MKTLRRTVSKKFMTGHYAQLVLGLSSALALWTASVAGQDSTSDTRNNNRPTPETASQPASAKVSAAVGEILKLADAGVSTNVIRSFVETSTTAPKLTETDIIALKQHNVPDEVTMLLLKRGADALTAASQNRQEAVVRLVTARRMASGGLDRESYDYFQYYYLQPRALASAYQRLSPYYSPYSFRHYGYASAYRFAPLYSGRAIYGGGPYLP